MPSSTFNELKDLISGDVTIAADDISRHSRDASIFQVQPEVIVYPKDQEDIKKVVSWVSQHKSEQSNLSITARAAGTDMSGGPLNESIILDVTKYLNHVIEVGDYYAVTEPGAYYRNFEKETLKKGFLLPSYPASKDICAMGGIVANNSGGEKSLSYGKTEKYVKELNVVLSDGNEYNLKSLNTQELEQKKSQDNFEGKLYKDMHQLLESNYDLIQMAKPDVSKNSAGYALWNVWDRQKFDLTKLFVGSQGTLGLMTKIKLDLIKPKQYSKLLVIFLKDLGPLGDMVNAVVKYKPESFESYDDQTLKLAVKFLPDFIKKLGPLSLFRFLPEVGMVLSGGLPKLVLIAEFTSDNEKEVDEILAKVQAEVTTRFHVSTRITHTKADSEKYWAIRRESFNLLRKHVGAKHTAPFIDDVIVHVAQLPMFLPKLNELVSQYKGLSYTIAGHAGDANFHIIPLMDFHSEENRRAIPELSEKVYDLVVRLKGSITAEHNDGLIRTPYLEKMYGRKIIELFEQTKQIFDPQNIFNPGKKVHGSMQFALSHIIKE
ncbi:FAD-binding oxidoreductase [Candidatus Parcubacteria bacterium]|nr:FAD-binding oxidoreductase [Candidatus Parcubacteria bacterium]